MKTSISLINFNRKKSEFEKKLLLSPSLTPKRKLDNNNINPDNILKAKKAEIVDNIPDSIQLITNDITKKQSTFKKKPLKKGILNILNELIDDFNKTNNKLSLNKIKDFNPALSNIAIKLYMKKNKLNDHFNDIFNYLPGNKKNNTVIIKKDEPIKKNSDLKKTELVLKSNIFLKNNNVISKDIIKRDKLIKKNLNLKKNEIVLISNIPKKNNNIKNDIDIKIEKILKCVDCVDKVKLLFKLFQCNDNILKQIIDKLSFSTDKFVKTMIFKRLASCNDYWVNTFLFEKLNNEKNPILIGLILNALDHKNINNKQAKLVSDIVKKKMSEELTYSFANFTIKSKISIFQETCLVLSKSYSKKITLFSLLKKAAAGKIDNDKNRFMRTLLFNPYNTIRNISCGILKLPVQMKKLLSIN